MRGTAHGRKYVLGEQVRIRVDGADTFLRTVDFDIVEE